MTPCTPGSIAPVARYAAVLARALPASSLARCEPCEPGQFQDVEGQVVCKPCSRGGYCVAGAASPSPCPAGTYGGAEHATGVADCTACKSGMSCPVGSTEETPCSAGSYTNESAPTLAERRRCIKCAAGTYQSGQQSTGCKVCEKGGYCTVGAAMVRPGTLTVTLTPTLTLTLNLTLNLTLTLTLTLTP